MIHTKYNIQGQHKQTNLGTLIMAHLVVEIFIVVSQISDRFA